MKDFRYIRNVATLHLNPASCSGCGVCSIVCPHRILAIEKRKAVIQDLDLCMECGACSQNCPTGALTVRRGVGCAAAVINGWIRKTDPSCDCSSGPECC
ncbi:MAG TPA: mercury methylation ferredoxin HgcB [Thermoanaerobaculia bacterium]|nr:mercury methylation ferredoxin HgcB [Thermoanaerobaculia bacterium]HUM30925.1 mercury methylation ferredoxin HgcB [Thermoanaerobaculia bacterium]HXK69258.1 mercury methylation ferredoxin HgcB [Thermoanaerobaculia bacterium]